MANIRLIKNRIKSSRNISQMTSAMEMVSASKMKKAQEKAILGKPYANKIFQMVHDLARRIDPKLHPLLSRGNIEANKKLIILISTNKGLCGGLNTLLFKNLLNYLKVGTQAEETSGEYISVGKKGERFLARSGKDLIADFSQKTPFSDSVGAIIKLSVDGFLQGKYSEVLLIYNTFINSLKQVPTIKKILPLTGFSERLPADDSIKESEFLIEPGPDEVLDSLLPHYLENQVRFAIYDGEASEHSARMIAMKNASEAANDLIAGLSLLYNKARQEKITYEIADIVTARLAVEL